MDIGRKIKSLRQQLELTQAELADRAELTKGFISQIERNQASPSIATLKDILECLGTDLPDFFAAENVSQVVYTDADRFEKKEEQSCITWLIPNAQKYEMEPILLSLLPGGCSQSDQPHPGEEFGYVLSGEVVVKLGNKTYAAKAGDSFYYKSNVVHQIKNNKQIKAEVLWISTPPYF